MNVAYRVRFATEYLYNLYWKLAVVTLQASKCWLAGWLAL
jgi:hypothetical protein